MTTTINTAQILRKTTPSQYVGQTIRCMVRTMKEGGSVSRDRLEDLVWDSIDADSLMFAHMGADFWNTVQDIVDNAIGTYAID